MTNYTFRLIVQSDADFERLSDLFYEEFDGLLAESQGRLLAQINVTTDAAAHEALRRTIQDVERALPVRVREIDADLVDIPEIAERIGRSRQNVQQLVTGARGPGSFPAPVGTPGGIRIWDWESVARWLSDAGVSEVHDVGASRTDAAKTNAWLATRQGTGSTAVDRLLFEIAAVVDAVSELASADIDRVIGSLGSLWRALLTEPLDRGATQFATRRHEQLTVVKLEGTAGIVARAGAAMTARAVRAKRQQPVSPQLDRRTVTLLAGAA